MGKSIIGSRIAAELILELLDNGWTVKKILRNYPQLKRENVAAALKYATEILRISLGFFFQIPDKVVWRPSINCYRDPHLLSYSINRFSSTRYVKSMALQTPLICIPP
jgi:hypothetical protein